MVDTFQELSKLSSQLNKSSDEVNEIISSVNRKLAGLNLGIEIWPCLISATDYEDGFDDEGRRNSRQRDAVELGYARLDDEWQLGVREVTYVTELNRNGIEYEETTNVRDWKPLLKASREIRLEALDQIGDLLGSLKEKAARLVKAIENGKKAASEI